MRFDDALLFTCYSYRSSEVWPVVERMDMKKVSRFGAIVEAIFVWFPRYCSTVVLRVSNIPVQVLAGIIQLCIRTRNGVGSTDCLSVNNLIQYRYYVPVRSEYKIMPVRR